MENVTETWSEAHLYDVVADVCARLAATTLSPSDDLRASEGVTLRNISVTVTTLRKARDYDRSTPPTRASDRVARLVTIASHVGDIVALEAAAHLAKSLLEVNAKIIVEVAHVTMLFTLGQAEDAALRERAKVLATRRVLV